MILDKTNESDDLWNWSSCFFWGKDVSKKDSSHRAVRGWSSARRWGSRSASPRVVGVGFRPALEILTSDPLCADNVIKLEEQEFSISQLQGAIHKVFYLQLNPIGGNPFANIPNGTAVKMYTLLCDEEPVRQDGGKPATRTKGEISITDQFYGEEFLIPWVISNGIAVASRPVLQGISPNVLKEQGFFTN